MRVCVRARFVNSKCMLRVTEKAKWKNKGQNYTVKSDWLSRYHDYCIANRASVTSGTSFLCMQLPQLHVSILDFRWVFSSSLWLPHMFLSLFAHHAFNCMIRCSSFRSLLSFSISFLIELNYNKFPFSFPYDSCHTSSKCESSFFSCQTIKLMSDMPLLSKLLPKWIDHEFFIFIHLHSSGIFAFKTLSLKLHFSLNESHTTSQVFNQMHVSNDHKYMV